MTLTRPPVHWHRILLASTVAAALVACGSSTPSDKGSGGSGSGGSGTGGSGTGGSGTGGSGTGGLGGGGAGGGTGALAAFGQRYKIQDSDIPEWKQDSASNAFALYTDANLTDRIDGPATGYVQRGMKLAYYQNMVGPDPKICTVVGMDFVTEANAKSMNDFEQKLNTCDLSVPPYDTSAAIAYKTMTGISAFAHFGALYIELVLDGYGADQEAGLADAAIFLKALEAKTK
jgi:hypothetical protein